MFHNLTEVIKYIGYRVTDSKIAIKTQLVAGFSTEKLSRVGNIVGHKAPEIFVWHTHFYVT